MGEVGGDSVAGAVKVRLLMGGEVVVYYLMIMWEVGMSTKRLFGGGNKLSRVFKLWQL